MTHATMKAVSNARIALFSAACTTLTWQSPSASRNVFLWLMHERNWRLCTRKSSRPCGSDWVYLDSLASRLASLLMFSHFHGNAVVVNRIREMLARDRFPHAVILAGPNGAGKFTLAQMVAKTMNCLERPLTDGLPDFCGRCSNCTRIALADDLASRCAEAVEAREN